MAEEAKNKDNYGPFSIGVIGAQVGKSRLICRFLYDEFKDDDDPTVEDTYSRAYNVDSLDCKLEILDTSGNDFYANLYEKWFSSTEAFVLVYSVTSTYSFDAIPHYVQAIKKIKKVDSFPMILVATQADMPERQITAKEGLSVAYRYRCPFLEVSSKTGENIEQVFQNIVREIRKERAIKKKRPLDNPDKSGSLMKLNPGVIKSWKKSWAAIKDGIFYLYVGQKEYEDHVPLHTITLLTCTVKPVMTKDKKFCFELISINQNFTFQTDTKEEMLEWMLKIQEGIAMMLNSVTSEKEKSKKEQDKSPEEEWRIIQQASPGNRVYWCSINLGLLMCIQCSGVHRSLGTHISKVRSLTLDKLDDEIYEFLRKFGNEKANKIWESVIGNSVKPSPNDERSKKEKWIRAKYVDKNFIANKGAKDSAFYSKNLYSSAATNDLSNSMISFIQGGSIDWQNSEENMQTSLHKSAIEGHLLCAVWLIQNGANIEIRDKNGNTALDLAKANKKTPVETWIIKKGGVSTQNTASSTNDTVNDTVKPEKNTSSEIEIEITFEPMTSMKKETNADRGLLKVENPQRYVRKSISLGKTPIVPVDLSNIEEIAVEGSQETAEKPKPLPKPPPKRPLNTTPKTASSSDLIQKPPTLRNTPQNERSQTVTQKSNLGETLSESKSNGNRPNNALNNQSLSGPMQVLSPSKSHSTLRVVDKGFVDFVNSKTIEELVTLAFSNTKHDIFDRKLLGEFLGSESSELSSKLLHAIVNQVDFGGVSIDEALRKFLKALTLPRKAQKFIHIMRVWSARYFALNSESYFTSLDTVYTLACWILTIQLHLHVNKQIHMIQEHSKPISKSEFVRYCAGWEWVYKTYLKGANGGQDFPKDVLEAIFDRISATPIDSDWSEMNILLSRREHTGWLTKQGGKRKTWKRRWCVLSNDCVMYFKNQKDGEPAGIVPLDGVTIEKLSEERERDLKKKCCFAVKALPNTQLKARKVKNGGTLKRGNHEEFLFSADSDAEMETWIECVLLTLERNAFYQAIKDFLPEVIRSRAVTLTDK